MNAPAGTTLLARLALAALPLVLGCGEEKKKDAVATDAGPEGPQKPVLGGKLAAAVKAAESAQAGSPSSKSTDGPPENGVFAAGAADKAQPPGAPPKVEVISDGQSPGYAFTYAPVGEQKEVASITLRIQGGAIPIEYGLALKVDKPKDEKKDEKKDDKKDDKGADKKLDPPGTTRVYGKVAAVGYPSQIPRELGDKLGKLKGSEIRYALSAAGGASDLSYAVPKDTDPGLSEAVVKGLCDAIAIAMPPLPPKPVGVGGYWIVTDRASALGIETVRYRVYTVDKIDKDVVSLTLQVRQYATKEEVELGALAQGQKIGVARFESSGTSKIDWSGTSLLPPRAETSVKVAAAGTVGGQQQILQLELVGRFTADVGDKKK